MTETTNPAQEIIDTAIAAAYTALDAEYHDDLCACATYPESCVTYGTRKPWSYDAEAFARAALASALSWSEPASLAGKTNPTPLEVSSHVLAGMAHFTPNQNRAQDVAMVASAIAFDRARRANADRIAGILAEHSSGPNGCTCGEAPDVFWERELRAHVTEVLAAELGS